MGFVRVFGRFAVADGKVAGRRVLIVEDDYFLASELAATLTWAGAEVVGPVANVRDGLAALDRAPDIATLDVQLGDETSLRLADELVRRGIPFVFATGSARKIPVAHAGRAVCHKPVANQVILKALADALSE